MKTMSQTTKSAAVVWAENRLEVLDKRLGKNVGAVRERKRLLKIVNQSK